MSFIYSEARKKFETTSKSIRIDVDSVRALAQYFFEARKNRASVPALGPVWSRHTRRREDNMKRFTAAILAGAAMSLTLASVAQAKDKV
ncbi:hypothetical protein EN962_29860, partial [Mesorhizobium sp. M7A.F.Ca.CA.001.09.2.1]|uniref:hypothetical protein n=1 Tax=Mesorhizobium sp. M7A.F.Ca.CA.001.09.2.1 TaxID=2496719 RepID=UPI000FD41896